MQNGSPTERQNTAYNTICVIQDRAVTERQIACGKEKINNIA